MFIEQLNMAYRIPCFFFMGMFSVQWHLQCYAIDGQILEKLNLIKHWFPKHKWEKQNKNTSTQNAPCRSAIPKKHQRQRQEEEEKNASAIVERSICAIFESCKNNDLKSQPVINHRIVGSFLHLSEEQQLVSTSVVAGGQLTFVNVFKVEL